MRFDPPDTERTIESRDFLPKRERGSKRKTGWWVAVGLVGACCGAVLLTAFLNPGNTLKVGFFVMKDAVVVVNGDEFDYENLLVTMVKGSISNEVNLPALGVRQSAELMLSPKFIWAGLTPDYIQVEVLRDNVAWRARWREHVEGDDPQARSLRKRYIIEVISDRADRKLGDGGYRREHSKEAMRDFGSESLLTGSQNPSAQEPSYEGRPLSQWISLYFDSDEHGITTAIGWQQRRVDDAVQHMGTNALHCLIRWLACEGDKSSRAASHDPNRLRSWHAMEALGRLGTDAIPVLPELKLLLNNNTNRELAIKAYCVLEKLKGVAVPMFAEAAENRHHPARGFIVGHFCDLAFGPERAAVMPTLTRLLQEPDPEIPSAMRARVSNAVNRIHPSPWQKSSPPLTLTQRASWVPVHSGNGEIVAYMRNPSTNQGIKGAARQ